MRTGRRTVLAGIALLAIFGFLAWHVGAAPFVTGIRQVTIPAVLVAGALTAVATVVAAWRWSVIAMALGSTVPLRRAVAAYYRSQFLNSVLPGGVLGDVERGVTTADGPISRARGVVIVAWDRVIGQAVQFALLLVVVFLFDEGIGVVIAGLLAAAAAAVGVLLLFGRRGTPGRLSRYLGGFRADAHVLFTRPRVVARVVGASVVVALIHASVFVLAAVVTGTSADAVRLLPVALAVEAAMAVPLSVAGWGPREGAAAVLFGTVGLGAAHGVAASVAYGVLALIAVLPGAVVLLVSRLRAHRVHSAEHTGVRV